jgi:hypothetical protein
MDWDLKAPAAWDLADLAAPAGPSSSGARHVNAAGNGRAPAGAGRPECSVDLKLGHGGGAAALAAADRRSREPAAGKAPAPSSATTAVVAAAGGANKRPRPAGGGQQQCPSCAVDGCEADLSKCRDYHRRHKVCEAHSKTPLVVVAGREMRFCQQCSR